MPTNGAWARRQTLPTNSIGEVALDDFCNLRRQLGGARDSRQRLLLQRPARLGEAAPLVKGAGERRSELGVAAVEREHLLRNERVAGPIAAVERGPVAACERRDQCPHPIGVSGIELR